jgi:hypothetical protein
MARYNPVNDQIAAGAGISIINNSVGIAIISATNNAPSTTVANSIAIYIDTQGTFGSSGITIDSSNNIAGISSVGCAAVELNSNNTYYTSIASPNGLTETINYIMPATIGNAGNLLVLNSVLGNTATLTWATAGGEGIITSVTGTTHQISVTSGTAPQISIASDYAGQSSITTIGTITTGTWNASNLTESQITNLTTDLEACEKIANKGVASGYCPLNSSTLVPLSNIQQDMSIDLLSNSLAAFVDKNSINNIGDNLLNFYNYNQNYPLASLYANWITISVANNSYRTNIDACYPVTFTKINYTVNSVTNGGYTLNIYGSNNTTNFYDTSTSDLSSLTLVNSSPITITATGNTTVTPSGFRYYHLLFTPVNSGTSTLTVVLSFNYKNYSPVCGLDLTTGYIATSTVPNYLVKSINGITTTNNAITLDLSNLNDCAITTSTLANNQGLIYNSSTSTWVNQQIDHTTLANIGTNTHAQIDSFIASKSNANGLAALDSNGQLVLSQIPSIALTTVNVVATIAERNALTGILTGDVVIVTGDPISSNDGSYIYNGTGWSTLSVYIQPTNLSSLTDVSEGTLADGNLLEYSASLGKWTNYIFTGNTSITTLGAVTTGTWNAGVIGSSYGGTGVNNSGNTITIGGSVTVSGAYTTTLNVTGNTNITLPTSGTLATTSSIPSLPLSVANGGTGQSYFAPYCLLLGNQSDGINTTSIYVHNGYNMYGVGILSFTNYLNTGTANFFLGATMTENDTYILPTSMGAVGNVLTIGNLNNTTNAILSWTAPSVGTTALAGLTTDTQITGTPVSGSLLMYQDSATNKWINTTIAPTNDQLLVYTTYGSANSWTPYTLSGATFSDSTKTITIASGTATALQSATTVVSVSAATAPTVNQALVATSGTSATWQIPTVLGTVTTGVWAATPVTVAYGGTGAASCTAYALIAGGTTTTGAHQSLTTGVSNQILLSGGAAALPTWTTNLTVSQGGTGITSTTACGVLCGGTTTTGVLQNAGAGTLNQALISNGTAALPTWETISTSSGLISDISVSSLATGDVLRWNGTKFANSTSLTGDEATISNLQLSTGVVKTQASVTQNTTITTTYVDGTDGYTMYINNSSSVPFAITAITSSGGFSISGGNSVSGSGGGDPTFNRINLNFGVVTGYAVSVYFTTGGDNGNTQTFYIYGSNNATCYANTSNTVTGATLLYTSPTVNPQGYTGSYSLTNTTVYQYFHILRSGGATNVSFTGLQVFKNAGSTSGLVNGTDFTVSTDAATGKPAIKYTDAATNTLTYNETTLSISELYRRIYPVIYNSSDIVLSTTATKLTGYAATSWNIENYSGTLNYNYNGTTEMAVSSAGTLSLTGNLQLNNGSYSITLASPTLAASSTYTLPSAVATSTNQFLYTSAAGTGTNTLAWSTLALGNTKWTDVSIASPASGNILKFNGTNWTNTTDLTTVQSQITTLLVSTGILVNQSSVAQGTSITTGYTDGTNGNIVFGNNTTASNMTPTAFTGYPADNWSINGYKVWDGGHTDWNVSNTTSYLRLAINYGTLFQVSSFYWSLNAIPTNGSNINFNVYGGTLASVYTDTAYDTTNLTLLCNVALTTQTGSVAITNTSQFQYIVILVQDATTTNSSYSTNNGGFWVQKAAGGYNGLILATDWNISSSTTTGAPIITYADSTTQNLTYNVDTLLVEEAYRRLYPVVRSTSDIVLTSTSNTLSGYASTSWNIENNSSILNFNYNGATNLAINSSGAITTGAWYATAIATQYGGSGLTATTPYAIMTGGTTSTGALQQLATGASGQLLVSGGSGALAGWSSNISVDSSGDIGTTGNLYANNVIATGNLAVSGTITSGTITASVASSTHVLKFICPVSYTLYTFDYICFCPQAINSFIIDLSMAKSNIASVGARIVLPSIGVNQSIYLQFIGANPNPLVNQVTIGDNSSTTMPYFDNAFYFSPTNWSLGYVYNGTGATFKFTFYSPASANPWYSGNPCTTPNSWQIQQISSNQIPLPNSINLIYIYSCSNTSLSGYYASLILPTLVSGQQICIKDATGYLNYSNVQVIAANNDLIDGMANRVYNTANLAFMYTYVGNGSYGNLFSLFYSTTPS